MTKIIESKNVYTVVKIGKLNDAVTYACTYKPFADAPVKLVPAEKADADVMIYSDSGTIPGIAQSDLDQYICDQAAAQIWNR